MTSQQKISVIIPSYNRANSIHYCLDSVLKQTLSAYEIIIVDDCSTDNTAEILKSYKDSRIRHIVLEKNSGAQAARNRGILEASGEWIAFLDSDDEWILNKLELQMNALQRVLFDEMTVVHTDCWRYEPTTNQRELWRLPEIDGPGLFSRLLSAPGPLFPAILTSRKALDKIGLLDERVPSYQEWDTSIRLAKECRFIHLSEPLFVYHLHEGETISKDSHRDIEGYQYIVDKFSQAIIENCGLEVLEAHLRQNAVRAMRRGLFDEAKKILSRSSERSFEICLIKLLACTRKNPDAYLRNWKRIQNFCSTTNDNLN